MAVFAVTFRIHQDSKYQERYDSVVTAIKNATSGNKYWEDTTSFFLLENPSNSEGLANLINQNSQFDEGKDLLVVFNMGHKGAYKVLGRLADGDIHVIMKKV